MIINKPTSLVNIAWLKQIPSSIALLDHDFRLIDASEQWCEKFEISDNESIKGKTLFDIFPRLSDNWLTKLEYALDGLKDIQLIDKIELSSGAEHNFIWYLNPWKDGYGNKIGVVVNVKDVTETKKLQLELSRTRGLLQEKGNLAKIGSWEYIVNIEEVLLSPIVEDILKVKKDEKITLNNVINFHTTGNSRVKFKNAISQALNSGTPWDENLELKTSKGKSIWVNSIGRPKFKDGKCARIIGTMQAITNQVSVVEKVGVKQEQTITEYQQFFKLSPVGMVVFDYSTGKVLDANNAFCRVTGYSLEDLKGKSYKSFQVLNNPADKSNMLKQLVVTNGFELSKINFVGKNGKKKIVNLSGELLSGENNSKKIITSIVNVSLPNRRTENLRKQVADANQNIEKLVNFTHMVSHNLKGHATNFTLLLNFLDSENREDERKKLLSIIKDGNENLTETIKGLREIVAIRKNNKLTKEHVVLNDYIYKAEQRLAGRIKKEKAKIINEIGDDFTVYGLPAYVENILVNCLSNAVKFRKPKRTPVVIISTTKTKTHTILSIEDNGIGMDLEKHEDRLFGLYKTLTNSGEARGMGLYLTKYQVELMKGKIEVESALGEGTTFKIYFPNK